MEHCFFKSLANRVYLDNADELFDRKSAVKSTSTTPSPLLSASTASLSPSRLTHQNVMIWDLNSVDGSTPVQEPLGRGCACLLWGSAQIICSYRKKLVYLGWSSPAL